MEKGNKLRTDFYNFRALETATEPIFIVENYEQAIKINNAGGTAIGLNYLSDNGGYRKFIAALKSQNIKPAHALIVCSLPENESEMKHFTGYLDQQDILWIPYLKYITAEDIEDSEALKRKVADALEKIGQVDENRRRYEREATEKESALHCLDSFIQHIKESQKAPCYKTGFSGLDKIIDGGLYAGLYTIGAISSLGKTTFCLQIADNIAAAGQDVLIFSLEMARDELMAKSISRNTALEALEENIDIKCAKSTRQILNGRIYNTFTDTERKLLGAAIERYKQYAGHLYINEGVGNIGTEQIRQKAEQHIRTTGNTPVILIDYLQILAPADVRASDKQNTDKAVLELKRISRDLKTPVMCISSFNRQNYTDPVNLASFKESGAIEYSADVLIGIQFAGMDYEKKKNNAGKIVYEDDKERKARVGSLIEQQQDNGKKGRSQQIQVKVLKNRNGYKDDFVIEFYPYFNYFTEGHA